MDTLRRTIWMAAVLVSLSFGGVALAQEVLCNDGVDNDSDGKTDCQDTTNCKSTPFCVCRDKGTSKEVAKAVNSMQKTIVACRANADKGKATANNCISDAMSELGSTTKSANYGGKIRKALDNLHKGLAKRCSGPDEIPYTADDVGLTDLDFDGALQLHGWGAQLDIEEEFLLLTQLKDQTTALTFAENTLEEDCVLVPIVPMAPPGDDLQRLLDVYQCLVVSEAVALAIKSTAVENDPELSVYKSRIVRPPATHDGGSDQPLAPDGVNDDINIPSASACPLPGIGACAADPNVTCSLAPGSGSDTFCLDCAESDGACPPSTLCSGCPLCLEALTGPDGVGPGDVATQELDGGKCLVKVASFDDPNDDYSIIKCLVEGIKTTPGDPNTVVTTVKPGTCNGGPNNGLPCNHSDPNATHCDDAFPQRYACVSGDEYFCQVHGIVGSNADGVDSCGPCLTALVLGPPGTGCGAGGGGLCAIAQCVGGVRDGQICDITGATSCVPSSGGICGGVGGPAVTTGDEVGFYAPSFSGMAYLLCPLAFRLDFPMDLTAGTGVAIADVMDAPLSVCVPDGSQIESLGCFIHENTDFGTTGLIEFYTSAPVTDSHGKIPCPGTSLPLPGASTGLPTRTGVGPVIGVSGVSK